MALTIVLVCQHFRCLPIPLTTTSFTIWFNADPSHTYGPIPSRWHEHNICSLVKCSVLNAALHNCLYKSRWYHIVIDWKGFSPISNSLAIWDAYVRIMGWAVCGCSSWRPRQGMTSNMEFTDTSLSFQNYHIVKLLNDPFVSPFKVSQSLEQSLIQPWAAMNWTQFYQYISRWFYMWIPHLKT